MFKSVIQLAAVASLSQLALADLNFVFGAGNFQTISEAPGGFGESGHYSGFSLITDSGEQLFDNSYVNGYSPCFNTDPESRMEVSSSCWNGPITFSCKSGFDGIPEQCAGDYEFNHFEGSATSDTNFIGIAIAQDGKCGGSVVLNVNGCTKDNANISIKYPTRR